MQRALRVLIFLIVTTTFLVTAGCERQDDGAEDKSDLVEEESTAVAAGKETALVPYPSNDWECSEASAEAVTAWLEAAGEWPTQGFYFPKVDDLPVVEGSARLPGTPRLVVGKDELHFDEQRFGDLEELREGLQNTSERLRAEQQIMGSDDPIELAVAVQSDVGALRLTETLGIVEESDFEGTFFVFASPPVERGFEAVPEELTDRLRSTFVRTVPENRQQLLAAHSEPLPEVKAILEDCPEIEMVGDALSATTAGERSRVLREKLPQAWLRCDCRADIEFLTAIHSLNMEIYSELGDSMHATAVESSVREAIDFLDGRQQETWGELAAEFASSFPRASSF